MTTSKRVELKNGGPYSPVVPAGFVLQQHRRLDSTPEFRKIFPAEKSLTGDAG
jgi:hypothetical protein